MMHADEEAVQIEKFLKPGSPAGAHLDSTVPHDWDAILRNLDDGEDASFGTIEYSVF